MSGIPSATHANVEPGSEDAHANAGASVLIVEPSAGPDVIVVCGGDVSTVNVRDAGDGSVSGTEFVAATRNAFEPSASDGVVYGDAQATETVGVLSVSIEHVNVALVWLALNSNCFLIVNTLSPPLGRR